MSDNKQDKIKALEELTKDKQHIRKHALRIAGLYLQGAKDEIVENEINNLDDEEGEDEDILAACETLIEKIADEVVKIGDQLAQALRESEE